MNKMKTLKFLSILFLCCLIISSFSFFAVNNVKAETWTAWDSVEYSHMGFSEYNPIQREYFGNDFFAYAYYNSEYYYLVIGSLSNSSISETYVLYNIGNLDETSIALNYDGNYTLEVFCIGNDNLLDYTYASKISFNFSTLTSSLIYNEIINAVGDEIKNFKWGTFVFDGDNYIISAILKIKEQSAYDTDIIVIFKYDTVFKDYLNRLYATDSIICDFCITNYYGGKIYTLYTYSDSDNYYLNVLDGVTLSATSSIDSGLDLIGKGTRVVVTGGLSLGYSLLCTVSTTIDADTIAFIYGIFDDSETKADCYIITVTYSGSSLTDTSATKLYGFTSGVEVLPAFINYGLYGYQVWYSPSMARYYYVNGISYTYEVIQHPTGTGGSSNTFFGDKIFVQKTTDNIVIWTTFGEVTPPPELPLETPFPSSVGDPAFSSWWNSNNINLITIMIPFMFILIPALLLSVFFGGMGLVIGLLLGSVVGTLAGVVPSWAFVILFVGIVAMLFVGRSRSGNSGVSE